MSTDTDFAIYQGVLGNFTSHLPEVCTTGGSMTATFAPASGNRYYLVVAHNGSLDGSYGYTSSGAERAVSGSACHPQSIVSCP